MRGVILGAVLAAALCGASTAQVIARPDWARKPSGDDIARYYPSEAIDGSVSGRVVVVCVVGVDGALRDCKIESETPAGMGFGDAVLKMAVREFRMKPQIVDGKPVDGAVIRVPIQLLAPSPSARAVVYQAVWDQAPSFDDMAAAWPAAAGDLETGSAVLRCRVDVAGDLRNCTIVGQAPKGSPFGEAARSLAGKFRMKMTGEDADNFVNADVALSFRFFNPATPAGQAKKIARPDWIARIDPAKVVALYPPKAADAGVREGVGVADCLVTAEGRLTECRPSREEPADLGFGPAAVLAVSVMRMNPWTPEGRPVAGARVKVPIKFSLAPESEAEAPSKP